MTMFEKAEPYIGTEKVSSEYIKWLTDSINVASGSPIRRQISTSDIPSGIPVLVYGKDDTNSPPALLYFEIDGDFLFWYQRNEFIEIIPESMTAEHQYDPNYETEGQFIRKKPETPSISQDSAYTIATQYLDTIGADLNLYSVLLSSSHSVLHSVSDSHFQPSPPMLILPFSSYRYTNGMSLGDVIDYSSHSFLSLL